MEEEELSDAELPESDPSWDTDSLGNMGNMDEPKEERKVKSARKTKQEAEPKPEGSRGMSGRSKKVEDEEPRDSIELKEVKEQRKVKKEHKTKYDISTEPEEEPNGGFWKDMGVWRFVALVVTALLVASIFTNGFSFGDDNGGVKGALSKEEAVQKVTAYVNTNLLQPGLTATVQESKDVGDLYNIKLSIAGQTFDSYVTKDARLLFAQGFDLTAPLPTAPQAPAGSTNAAAAARVSVSADDDAMKGDASAPVTIIEFSDFQCPFCGRFFEDALPQIEDKYVKTGKVKFVYRDFPLESIHPQARPAAEAAECAHEQGKFWEFHDKLFANQQGLSVDNFKKWAQELGLESTQFNDCVDSKKYADEVSKDLADGSAAGVSGTPAFFVNGHELSGAQPFSAFEAVIEAELAAAQSGSDSNVATGAEVAEVAEAAPAAPVAEPAESVSVTITAKKFRFEPSEVRVKKGSGVRLTIKSSDVDFGFVLPDYGVSLDLNPGETADTQFTADKEGRFTFTCTNCDGKESVMKGTLVVE